MSAAEALRVAHAAGVTVLFDGEGLVLEASSEPPQAVLDALSRHKVAILALLRPGQDGWTAEHWDAYFDKRSGIATSHDGLPRSEAEALAFDCCVIEWLNRHPAPSAPGRCAWCGRPESPGAIVLPFGTEPPPGSGRDGPTPLRHCVQWAVEHEHVANEHEKTGCRQEAHDDCGQ